MVVFGFTVNSQSAYNTPMLRIDLNFRCVRKSGGQYDGFASMGSFGGRFN